MTHITVAHFPPFDTVAEPAPSVPRFSNPEHCTECSGLGCDGCCFTLLGYTPANGANMHHTLDTLERDVSQVCDTDDETRAGSESRQGGAMADQWDIMIRRASNGYIVRGWSFDDRGLFDTLIEDDSTDDAVRRLLWEVIEQLGVSGSRHDAKRIFVGYRPGDKHHDYHPRPCAECECGCDPDQSTREEDR